MLNVKRRGRPGASYLPVPIAVKAGLCSTRQRVGSDRPESLCNTVRRKNHPTTSEANKKETG